MGSLGVPEMIIIFVVALIVFGPKKLPELGKSLGKGLAEFRRASNELKSTLEEEVRAIETEQPASHHSDPDLGRSEKSNRTVDSEPELEVESRSDLKPDSETKVDAH